MASADSARQPLSTMLARARVIRSRIAIDGTFSCMKSSGTFSCVKNSGTLRQNRQKVLILFQNEVVGVAEYAPRLPDPL
ncbi:unnamed protein product [Sphagnum balticum]